MVKLIIFLILQNNVYAFSFNRENYLNSKNFNLEDIPQSEPRRNSRIMKRTTRHRRSRRSPMPGLSPRSPMQLDQLSNFNIHSLFEPNDCKCELRKFYVDIRSLKDIVTDQSVKHAMENPIFKSVNIGACINSCAENPNDGEHSIERAFRKKYKTVAVCGATEWDAFHALAVKNWSFDKKIRITKCGITDVRVADYEKAKAFLKQN